MNTRQLAAALQRAVGFENAGEFFEAEQLYRQLAGRRPAIDMAHYMYAQFLLRQGRYAEAWPHFMQRLQDFVYQEKAPAKFKQPYCTSLELEDAGEKTLLVTCDQGIGDALMCARYIPLVAPRFKAVVLVVFVGFRELFRCLEAHDGVSIMEYEQVPPPFDIYADAFSLPAIFRTGTETIPQASWLTVDEALVEKWRARLSGGQLNVGFVWQGNPAHARDAERSVPLSAFQPMLASGINAISLQVGQGSEAANDPAFAGSIKSYDEITAQLDLAHGKMLESAALITCLDLVISVDTAVVHLAGAIGTPAWVLLPKVPDWRWMMNVDFSPWYPRTRLFRARHRDSYELPIADMQARLQGILDQGPDAQLP
ncbi:glycosyltransferase family 9 protein [Thalassospiraceae bacterium LMO-JJ14]|nr:glycosyltransferase family 9 protein [Thalassospiraceae bacterium LMO-JJ14]